jgi:hypothetical protein
MAKARGKRHSRNVMQPVTINLEAEEANPKTDEEPERSESHAGFEAEHSGPDDAKDGIASSIEEAASPDVDEDSSSPDGEARAAVEEPGEERPAVASAPEGRRSGSLVAAVIGGVVALAGAAGLQWAGVIPQRQPDLSGLQQVPGAISAIEERLGNLELAASDGSKQGADNGDLASRLGAAETAIKDLQSQMSQGGDSGQIAKLSARLDDVQGRIDELASAQAANSGAGTSGLSDTLSEIETKLDDTTAAAASARDDLAGQIASLNAQVDELSAAVKKEASQPRVAGAIAAAALKSAIDRGVPFTAELDTYAAVSGESADVAALRSFAADGVPTQADLNREITQKADGMIAAAKAPSGNEGIVARLISGARSLVSVRPVGEVKGDTPEAIVARLEADINAGRLDAALKEYDALPEPSKQAAGNLADDIRARLTADNVVAKTISGALVPDGSSNGQGQ